MSITPSSFWDAIDILRKELNITKAELARRAKVDKMTFRKSRYRNKAMSMQTVSKIGNALISLGVGKRQFTLLVDTLAQMED